MSMLVHRCTDCGHLEQWHRGSQCSFGWCRCRAANASPEPEVIPTFYVGSRDTVPGMHAPGTKPFGQDYASTCACDACQQEYARLGGVA